MKRKVRRDLGVIVKGAGTVFTGRIFAGSAKFFIVLMLIRALGPSVFGVYVLGYTVFSVLSLTGTMGLERGLEKHVSASRAQGDLARTKGYILLAILLSLITGTFLGAALYVFAGPLGRVFGNADLELTFKLFSVGVPLGMMASVLGSATRAFKTTEYYVRANYVFRNLVFLLFIAGAFFMGLGLHGMIAAYLLSTFLTCLLLCRYLKKLFYGLFSFTPEPIFEFRTLLMTSVPIMYYGVLVIFLKWTDILMLGYFVTPEEVGFYKVAATLSAYVVMFHGAFLAILNPVISEYYQKELLGDLRKIFKVVAKWVAALSVPVFLIMVIAPGELTGLFGIDFRAAVIALMVLACAQLFNAFTTGTGAALMMTSYQRDIFVLGVIAVVYNVALNYLFIGVLGWGISGAAFATALTIFLKKAISTNLAYLYLKLVPFSRKMLKVAAFGGLSAAFGYAVKLALPPDVNNIVRIALITAAIWSSYAILVLRFALDEDDRSMISRIRLKIDPSYLEMAEI